jgi:uncharacterized protein HemX
MGAQGSQPIDNSRLSNTPFPFPPPPNTDSPRAQSCNTTKLEQELFQCQVQLRTAGDDLARMTTNWNTEKSAREAAEATASSMRMLAALLAVLLLGVAAWSFRQQRHADG